MPASLSSVTGSAKFFSIVSRAASPNLARSLADPRSSRKADAIACDILRLHQQSIHAVLNDFWDSTHWGGDDGQPARHRLEHRHRHSSACDGSAKIVARDSSLRDVCGRNPAGAGHAPGQSQLVGTRPAAAPPSPSPAQISCASGNSEATRAKPSSKSKVPLRTLMRPAYRIRGAPRSGLLNVHSPSRSSAAPAPALLVQFEATLLATAPTTRGPERPAAKPPAPPPLQFVHTPPRKTC